MGKTQAEGFTLIELVVTIAVMAIMAAIAFPSFSDTLRSNYVSTASNEILGSLALARSEAIRSNANGAICTSINGTSCGGDWNSGWLVWINNNGDDSVDIASGERVLRFTQAKAKAEIGGTATTINFDSRGRTTTGAQDISLKPKGYNDHLRCIHVSPTGQASVEKEACA
jgi:type IV fimbrial biogenesis protein FimT